MEKLALLGGTPVVTEKAPEEMFKWPIITAEDVANVVDVVINNKFSLVATYNPFLSILTTSPKAQELFSLITSVSKILTNVPLK